MFIWVFPSISKVSGLWEDTAIWFQSCVQAGRPSCSWSGWLRMSVHQLPGGEWNQAAHEGFALNSTKGRRCHISSATDSPVRNGITWDRGKRIKYVNWTLRMLKHVTCYSSSVVAGGCVHPDVWLIPHKPWHNEIPIISLTNCSTLD